MALEVRALDARLQIQFDLGVDGDGKKVTRSKSLSKIKSTALDQDLYDMVNALTAMQDYPVIAIRRVGQSELVNI